MAYFELDDDRAVDTAYVAKTIFMASVFGLAIWEVWSRHTAPSLLEGEVSVALILQYLLSLESRLVAEALYFLVAGLTLGPLYLFVWRPLAQRFTNSRHWFVHGFSYGVAMAAVFFVGVLLADYKTAYQSFSDPLLAGWLPGQILGGVGIAGMVRLREMGKQII
ncbi:MAG: hypothetical protein AAFW47_04245 [Pseudomonadota bacterium]